LYRNGGQQLLGAGGQRAITGLGERLLQTGGAIASNLPIPSVNAVTVATRVKELLPGGAAAARQGALTQATRAAGSATGVSALLGAGVATVNVASDVRSGAVTLEDAARYICTEAAKEGVAGFAGAAAITTVVALSGPLAPITAIGIGFGAATATRLAMPQTPEPRKK